MNQSTQNTNRGITGFRLASDIHDTTIYNRNDEEIGTINDLIVDGENGRIRFAVVGIGGFLGMGETNVMVPWNALQRRANREEADMHYTLDVTREQLEKAPRFDRDRLNEFYSRDMSEPVYKHYRVTYIA